MPESDPGYSYDIVPYASHPFAQTHPDRLATIGILFGMQPPPIERCRVLELGCAAGGNLLPMAAALPDSEFVGVDLSAREIEDGQQAIAAASLTNARLIHSDIAEVDKSLGTFDYILCHGVYSWVPAEVKDRILQVCRDQLNPQGIAYISYNTYPGWHLRGTVRDIMEYHARRYDSPEERVKHARALLDFLVKSVPLENNPYGLLLKNELDLLSDKADFYVFHEHLERFNEPQYFYQFDQQARQKGLRYLGEADFGAMSLGRFPEQVANILRNLAEDFEEMEQYMDFVRNRMFRQTLLCHDKIELQRTLDAERLQNLYVASAVRLEGSPTDHPTRFCGPHGAIATSDPLLKIALISLSEMWPNAIPLGELVDLVHSRFSPEPVVEASARNEGARRLAFAIVDCYAKQFVELSAAAPRFTTAVHEKPQVTSLARQQAAHSTVVTNLRHQMVPLSDLARRIVALLDGRHTSDEILKRLLELVEQKQLVVQAAQRPLENPDEARPVLKESLDRTLHKLAFDALLLDS